MENPNGNKAEDIIPVIDMGSGRKRTEVVAAIREAAQTWGVFRLVNHGIPDAVLDAMLDGLRRFHEQPNAAKINEYLADEYVEEAKKSKLTLNFVLHDDSVASDQFPPICRKEVEEYAKSIIELKERISEYLSEALGLCTDYFSRLDCMKMASLRCHYYPACPQQDSSSGLKKHSDSPFLTILLQDNVGGLQVLHEDRWVDVPPRQGSFIINIGDLMQLITNGKFKSNVHRVVMNARNEARVSAVCQFMPSPTGMTKPFSPIEELLSDANPPLYKKITFKEFLVYYLSKESEGFNALNHPSVRI